MTKLNKPSAGRILSPSEIEEVCFQQALNIRFEVQSDSREWVFLDTAKDCSDTMVSEKLSELSQTYPGQSLRAIDMTTGRLVDMT